MKQYPIATKEDLMNKNMLAPYSAPDYPFMIFVKKFNVVNNPN